MGDSRQEQMRRFLSERALKKLFLTEWYVESGHAMQFDANAREILERIAAETAQEHERAEETFREWQSRLSAADRERLETFDAEILHAARQGWLNTVIEAKDASAVFFHRPRSPRPRTSRTASRSLARRTSTTRCGCACSSAYTDSQGPTIEAGEGSPRP